MSDVVAPDIAAESRNLLPPESLELVRSWGGAAQAASYVFRPSTVEGIRDVFALARCTGRSVAFRGAGRSYGDAALNAENIVLDLTRCNRILQWNPRTGVITVEPGVTIKQIWEYTLPDGWWPTVVPGTMFPTIGGCAAMNVHGKNNLRVGPIGEQIEEFEIMLPDGEIRRCSRVENADLFLAAIGGFGMLGCFTSITMRLKRVYSGLLEVRALHAASLAAMIEIFEQRAAVNDYTVGWIDAFAGGAAAGRGVVHVANYLPEGADPNAHRTLRVEYQQLPSSILGLFPKASLWRLMRPFMTNPGVRLVNAAKYRSAVFAGDDKPFLQSHAAFAFLLDYVPDWKRAYGRGGLIQYQSFVPREHAHEAFTRQLHCARTAGLPPYLAVFKRHRPDPFLMTHAVDGYSLALDFKVTRVNRDALWRLAKTMDDIVLDAGGRFYFAKDSTLTAQAVRRSLGAEATERFAELKARCDPDGILETDLYRRLFDPAAGTLP